MKNNSAAIFIPARLNSSRFPRKILEPINGKPLIIHVLERAKSLDLCECYVACCCDEIKDVVESYGGKAILTNPDLPSGTDRIFAALETLDEKPEYVVNLQGDNPIFENSIPEKLLNVLINNPGVDMSTPVIRHDSLENFNYENLVKVVFDGMEKNVSGKAIYFSRCSIPNGAKWFYSHIGIYAYRYEALKKFVSMPQSFLEKTERLEQLRLIEADITIWAVPVEGVSLSVDAREDLDAVYKAMGIEK